MKLHYCLAVLLISSFFASLIQNNFGKTDISLEKLDTGNGQYIYYDLYKPDVATVDSKSPFIAIIPGFQRSKEALSNIAIELSRRGHVVALIDPYAQGLSSSSSSRRAATTEGYGMFALIEHVHSSEDFDYINKNLLGTTGHSMGGNAAIRGANYFGKQAAKENTVSKLHSIYISGYVLTLREDILEPAKSNMGISYALYDEGAFRNELKGWDAANMRIAPESITAVNSGLTVDEHVSKVELGKYYGDMDNSTLRVVFNEPLLHPFQPYNSEANANQLSYFDKVFDSPIKLDPYDQIWQWKELFTLINMIVGFLLIIPLTRFLLGINYFSSIVQTIPPALPQQSNQGKIIFWLIFIIGATVACITFIPMVDVAKQLFPTAANRELTWFFPQRMNNPVMLWALLNGTIGFILFFLSYHLFGKNHGVKKSSWGLDITKTELFKTILLALTVFIIYYLILYTIYFLFHIDYRFWFMGVRIFQPEMLLVLAMYFPFFFIFFFSNSLRVNGAMRFEGQPEWLSRLIAGFANSAGLMLIIVIQYSVFATTGTVYWSTNNTDWLSVNLLFGIVPIMFILPYFNRIFFQMTGRVYLGPIITCLIFIMILSTNTVIYLPL
ncbi:MAG: alpha/beta hydrolase [Gammaproteobacteria bacterium]|nr:alpha/beta hydrolase [Gammaproteobacteria bacterium]